MLSRADAGEGLGEEVQRCRLQEDVGYTQFPGSLDLPRRHRPGEKNDGQLGTRLADPPQDFDSVNPGHDDVQEHRVRRALLNCPETFFAAAGDEGLMALALENLGDNERHVWLIINDENSHKAPD